MTSLVFIQYKFTPLAYCLKPICVHPLLFSRPLSSSSRPSLTIISSSTFLDHTFGYITQNPTKMMKAVLKLEVHDDKEKKKAMKTVSGLPGVDSIAMDMKDKKLTVIGDIDPVSIVSKLRKLCHTDILSVGPAKEPEKKKEEPKKEEPKKKDEAKKDDVAELVKAYKAYNPHMTTYYHVRSVEEDPNACVIC